MLKRPLQTPPRYWEPKLSPLWIRFWRPFRLRAQLREQQVERVDVQGLEHLQQALADGGGIMITPNHPGAADHFAIYYVADQFGHPFHFMASWHTFAAAGKVVQRILQHHGVFSVDREGTDLRAFKQAVQILMDGEFPLVIFPEGETYYINDRITPFREGPATIAVTAAKKSGKPVALIPTAIKYHYLKDPTDDLVKVMTELEQSINWRPRPDLPLVDRIYRFAEGALALKEIEYRGQTSAGPLPERVAALREFILEQLEERYGAPKKEATVPERIKLLRQKAITQLEDSPSAEEQQQLEHDLDDVFFCVQLFTYPGDYVSEKPTTERIAETLEKFGEDVIGRSRMSLCAPRQVTVSLGEPLTVPSDANRKRDAGPITTQLEERVQALLDAIEAPANPD